ncbi:MAG: class I SAM-dependent methyltransferase [Chloroflexota bacterium]|jgi:SAM-dependent methyltransferase
MHDEDLPFLLSETGKIVLASMAGVTVTADNHLKLLTQLRKYLAPEQASAVLETTLLRQKAAKKFTHAGQMLFTREGLEQATGEIVAAHRARRFVAAGYSTIADLGCGIGGDAIALAGQASVIAIDKQWQHVRMTQANAAAYGVEYSILPVQADLEQMPPLGAQAFFFDPARRTTSGPHTSPSRRLRSTQAYQPPLNLIHGWRSVVPHGAVKVAPGIDYAEIPPDAEVEFVSLKGEVKEGVLWFGRLRDGAARRATLLPHGQTLSSADDEIEVEINQPGEYLYEPDGAVIRAHLVRQLAARIGATLIDPEIAYLTASTHTATPFARAFHIETYFPFQLKRLRAYLRENDIGKVTIKKRGSPLDPDDLRQALHLHGETQRILFLTLIDGQPIVLIGQAADNSESDYGQPTSRA